MDLKRQHRERLFLRTRRFWLTTIVLLFVSEGLSSIPVIKRSTLNVLDVFESISGTVAAPHCIIVEIDDHREALEQRAVLTDPNVLRAAIGRLLELKPRVIGVDIDTSNPIFATALSLPPTTTTKIVWARAARQAGLSNAESFQPDVVLGSAMNEPTLTGVAVFPRDVDWEIRPLQRRVPFGTKKLDTFYWAVVRAYCDGRSDDGCRRPVSDSDDGGRILFPKYLAEASSHIPLSDVLGSSKVGQPTIFAGKIVLLGHVTDWQDVHPTPVGEQSGVYITAAAIETELNDTAIYKAGVISKWLFKILLCVIIGSAFHWLRPIAAVTTSLLLCASLATAASVISLFGQHLWLDVVVIVVGLIIELLLECLHAAEEGLLHGRGGPPASPRAPRHVGG